MTQSVSGNSPAMKAADRLAIAEYLQELFAIFIRLFLITGQSIIQTKKFIRFSLTFVSIFDNIKLIHKNPSCRSAARCPAFRFYVDFLMQLYIIPFLKMK
ncbi:hypothetical protein NE562_09675 [Butyricicoccus faecihominis]|uniref:hypothetical protein n=1 Tax=Butyricicoccus faecihominis TaxID=1712515 RepID=UPI0024792C04|nr:hypothetical protein [Butyricicoccus faecihominis]MCQ5129929.1 hypothetical protein [Butyricicoccus faecihominis]